MANRSKTTQDGQAVIKLFADFGKQLQANAKRFNEEHKKTKERIERGTKLTTHRITL